MNRGGDGDSVRNSLTHPIFRHANCLAVHDLFYCVAVVIPHVTVLLYSNGDVKWLVLLGSWKGFYDNASKIKAWCGSLRLTSKVIDTTCESCDCGS